MYGYLLFLSFYASKTSGSMIHVENGVDNGKRVSAMTSPAVVDRSVYVMIKVYWKGISRERLGL